NHLWVFYFFLNQKPQTILKKKCFLVFVIKFCK
ncbi:unnamed protein product, partial [Staurois parvus]